MRQSRKQLSIGSCLLICMMLITMIMPICYAQEDQQKIVRVAYDYVKI